MVLPAGPRCGSRFPWELRPSWGNVGLRAAPARGEGAGVYPPRLHDTEGARARGWEAGPQTRRTGPEGDVCPQTMFAHV